MSKRDYNLQKGMQLQQLTQEMTNGQGGSQQSTGRNMKLQREVSKLRELCPPGTDDERIVTIIKQMKGNSEQINFAISELWEGHRGGGHDAWATVEKKGKKKEVPVSRGRSNHAQQKHKQTMEPQDDIAPSTNEEASKGRGSSTTGRGRFAARGGRSGRVRGRGGSGSQSNRGPRNPSSEGKDDSISSDPTEESDTIVGNIPKGQSERSSRNGKDRSNREKSNGRSSKFSSTAKAVAALTPPPVDLVLTGAWTKKPNFGNNNSVPQTKQQSKGPTQPSEKKVVKQDIETPKSPRSPKKKSKDTTLSPTITTQETDLPVEEKVSTPKTSPKKNVKAIDVVDITAGWGSIDVSQSSATAETASENAATTWARSSPLTAPVSALDTIAGQTATPASPTPTNHQHTEEKNGASIGSPTNYLKMGKWDHGNATNLSLQFGSFSLNGTDNNTVDSMDTTSPPSWGSVTTAATNITDNDVVTTWGNTTTSSPAPKSIRSPGRNDQRSVSQIQDAPTSGPPGLSVESGRLTPQSSRSPQFAPAAPSPASLPKPDNVKRNKNNRGQSTLSPNRTQTSNSSSAFGSFPNDKLSMTSSEDMGAVVSPVQTAQLHQLQMQIQSSEELQQRKQHQKKQSHQKNYISQAAHQGLPTETMDSIHNSNHDSRIRPSKIGQEHHTVQSKELERDQSMHHDKKEQLQTQDVSKSKNDGKMQSQEGIKHNQLSVESQTQDNQGGPNPAQSQGSIAQQHNMVHGQHGHGLHQSGYHPHYAPPPPPGMPYNPYSYANYYQYGYYQNPQYGQYNPRGGHYPPRGGVPYGMEGPMPGFPSGGAGMPGGYQDSHLLSHQHDYAASIPQGFGEIHGAYAQQHPPHHHPTHHHHVQHGSTNSSHGKGSVPGTGNTQSSHSRRGDSSVGNYSDVSSAVSGRDHSGTPPVPNVVSGASSGGYSAGQSQNYWQGYGGQPMGGWNHMMPPSYQPHPSQSHHHLGQHQQSYRQYGNSSSQNSSSNTETSGNNHSQTWNS